MKKTFCNKCGTCLSGEKCRSINMRIYGKIGIGANWDLDFCEKCFADTMGEEIYSDFIEKEKALAARVAARKAHAKESVKHEHN